MSAPLPLALRARFQRYIEEGLSGRAAALRLKVAAERLHQPATGNSGVYGSFEFGGITWANYRGGQNVGIDTDKCHLFPMGVPGLFRTVYGPADYIETVNTPGQRLYGKQWEMQNGKGVNLEFQMNALHYCTRPRVLIPAKRT